MSGSLVNDWSCVYPTAEQQVDEERARQYARAFYAEIERLKAEKKNQEKTDRKAHDAFCDIWSQYQPKHDYGNTVEEELLALSSKGREANPDKYLCEINRPPMDDLIEKRIETISESLRRTRFCDCE